MAEQKGIKEVLELLKGLEVGGPLSIKLLKGLKDGLGSDDVANLLGLAGQSSVLLTAVEGVREIPAEVKDLSEEEIIQVVSAVFAMARALKAA